MLEDEEEKEKMKDDEDDQFLVDSLEETELELLNKSS